MSFIGAGSSVPFIQLLHFHINSFDDNGPGLWSLTGYEYHNYHENWFIVDADDDYRMAVDIAYQLIN